MKLNFYKILFVIIVIVGAFFRLYNLSIAPPQPNIDEVSNAYNAYSILKTGADEYGYKLPTLIRGYDDFRPAINVYATIPFVATIGVNALSARLPSAILSIITVIAVYFLTKELTRGVKALSFGKFDLDIPIIVMVFFAVAPWDIYISRFGYEVNFAFSFLIFGILFFLRFINKSSGKLNNLNLYASALFFGLSFDSYQSAKIVSSLILLSLVILHFKELISSKRTLIIAVILGIVVITPILLTLFDKSALIRFSGTNLLSNSQEYFEQTNTRLDFENKNGDLAGKIFDNRKVASGLLISHAYLSHLSPVWLFINQGGEQFKAPTMGLLYLFEIPLVLLGLLFITRIGISAKNVVFIFFWGAIAIIPAAITTGYAHPLRIINILPVPQIISAIGLYVLVSYVVKFKKTKYLFLSLFFAIFIYSVIWFFHSYFVLMPRELAHHFQYGVLNALAKARETEGNYKNVYVSGSDRLLGSHMYYLYSNRYDPARYQAAGGTLEGGFASEHRIGKYIFGNINYKAKNALYVLNPGEVKDDMIIVDKVYYPNGELSLVLAGKK